MSDLQTELIRCLREEVEAANNRTDQMNRLWTAETKARRFFEDRCARLEHAPSGSISEPSEPEGCGVGLTIEHVLLSVTIVSNKDSAGQFDDSCSRILERELLAYHGIQRIDARVLYEHTKIEKHSLGCECGKCQPQPMARFAVAQ